ncbi:hypothetical protein [Nostoc sp.]
MLETIHALTFGLLSKDEAMEVYKYLDYSVQERFIEKLKSSFHVFEPHLS